MEKATLELILVAPLPKESYVTQQNSGLTTLQTLVQQISLVDQ